MTMKTWLPLAALTLALAACKAEPEPTALSLQTADGLAFTLLQIPGAEDVALQAAWPSDWAHRADVNPLAPYVGVDLILAGGAEGWASGAAVEQFADLRAEAWLWASPDHVFGGLVMPRDAAAEAVAITNAHLRAPSLSEEWFARLRDQLQGRIAEADAQPLTQAQDTLRAAILGEQPLTRALSLDEPQAFAALSTADIAEWHGQVFRRSGLELVIAGDLSADAARELVEAVLDGLPEGPAALAARPAPADFTPRRIVLHTPEANAASLFMMLPLPAMREGGEVEDLLIVHRLGLGDQSLVFDLVRNRLRAAYAIAASLDAFTRGKRMLVLHGQIEPARAGEVVETLIQGYAEFHAAGTITGLEPLREEFAAGARGTARRPAAASYAALMARIDGMDPGLILDMGPIFAQATSERVIERLQGVYPPAEDFLIVIGSPDPEVLPGACIISIPRDAANCR